MRRARVGDFVSKRIGIIETPGRELIKRRIGIRGSFLVGWKLQHPFPYAHLCPCRQRKNQQEEGSGSPPRRSYAGSQISMARRQNHLFLGIGLLSFAILAQGRRLVPSAA